MAYTEAGKEENGMNRQRNTIVERTESSIVPKKKNKVLPVMN